MSVQLNQNAPSMTPVREFLYGLPVSVNNAIHAAMQSNGVHLVAAGDD